MKNSPANTRGVRGFTLIELLVVIAIIAILAALLLPAAGKIHQNGVKRRALTELKQVELAIEAYKTKLGHFPPDNTNNFALNQLYYELVGCEQIGPGTYRTLDKSSTVTAAALGVTGLVNVSAGTASDDASSAHSFLKELKPAQYLDFGGVRRLGVKLDGPGAAMLGELNPFRYNKSNPTNNPNSFDLWVDIKVGGKTNRISNWSDTPTTL